MKLNLAPRIVLIVACGLLSVGCAIAEPTATPKPKTYALTGTFTLFDSDENWDREYYQQFGCQGSGGYGDVAQGLDVIVRDGQGEIIANGDLGKGKPLTATSCEFPLKVTDIPESDFYEVSVGRRGSTVYRRSELENQAWYLELSLGR